MGIREVAKELAPVPHDFVPSSAEELARCLSDPLWRLCSGQLYKIMLKQADGVDDATVVPFIPNQAQRELMDWLWYRNIILKARQLGFTTLVSILWLDHALFNADQRCGIIAQDRQSAEAIFRDKVKLAYDRLPDVLRERMPLARDSASELLFAHNNSSFKVATSMRSGTMNRLHVSEFGKICAKYPEKANEVVTGSLPSVPLDGITIIESTAEGKDGKFYTMTDRAISLQESGVELSQRDYRLHFFAWWREPAYRLHDYAVVITDKDHEYFDKIEIEAGTKLDPAQRAWYVATRDSDFSGDPQSMWQEYPSTPTEAFQVSAEGKFYSVQMAAVRKEGRICDVPMVENIPVNTFWDIGKGDGTGIWLHQRVDLSDRFIRYIEGWNEPYSYFTKQLRNLNCLWGTHYLPHDAGHQRQQKDTLWSALDELKKSDIGGEWVLVPRVADLSHGINLTRAAFNTCYFDRTHCKEGIAHLEGYGKQWNQNGACWSETPKKDIHTEGADAFRQFAQGYKGESESVGYTRNRSRSWKTA